LPHPGLVAPRRQRAAGRIAVSVERMGGASRLAAVAESGSARVRFPRVRDAAPEAVLINTAGGVAGGDRFATAITVGDGAELVVTSSAAEKVYRSGGETAELAISLRLGAGACLEWLPQETILFDDVSLRRGLDVDVAADSALTLFEGTVFGRAAFGERLTKGRFIDCWRIRRDRKLVFADTFRIEGNLTALLDRPAVATGAGALATFLYLAPDAESRLEQARACLEAAASECGASAWNGLLAVRFLAADSATLRRDASRFMTAFRGKPMPRVWSF
jgi:urease accessory protein